MSNIARTETEGPLAVAEGDEPRAAKAMIAEARASFERGEYAAALDSARAGLKALGLTGENDSLGEVNLILGSLALWQGQWTPGIDYFHDALASFRRSGNEWGMTQAYSDLAVAYKNLGRWDQAIDFSQRAEDVARRLGRTAAGFSLNQGIARYWKGDHEGAQTCFFRSLSESQRAGDSLRHARGLLALARLLLDREEADEAERILTRAKALAEERGYRRELALAHEALGNRELARGELVKAAGHYREAEDLARQLAPTGDLMASILIRQSALARARGESAEALHIGTRAVEIARQNGHPHDLARALIARAQAAYQLGQREEARRGFDEGLDLLRNRGIRFELARALGEIGSLLAGDSGPGTHRDEGCRLLEEAGDLFRSLGEPAHLARAHLRIAELRLATGDTDGAQMAIRHLREELAESDRCLPGALVSRLGEAEEAIGRHMSARASSDDNAFQSYERSRDLPGLLAEAPHPEEELLRMLLAKLGSDRGFLAIWPARGGGDPPTILARQRLARREAETIAQRLGAAESPAASPGVSLCPRNDSRLSGTPLAEQPDVGMCLWIRIPREGRDPALLYADRLEGERFQAYRQMDLNLAASLSHLVAVSLDNLELRQLTDDPGRHEGFVTRDERLRCVLSQAAKLNGAATTILLQGETGTGKGHLARVIHRASGRGGRFVTINCADLSETVLESELFGHVRGAFTDAHTDREGLFAQADGGTVFVDEIDKTSHRFQSRLLRVVDTREFKPVGDPRSRRLSAQIICASNRDLKAEVEAGRFLSDLYYRLKVICFTVPPLRERRGDIPLLVEHFLRAAAEEFGRTPQCFTPEARETLRQYSWPGNVRDLAHEIERAVLLADPGEMIGPESLSEEVRRSRPAQLPAARRGDPPAGRFLAEAVADLEREMVSRELQRAGGNKSRAARALGLTRRGLDNKIARYGLKGGG